jgi:hypothetical protein
VTAWSPITDLADEDRAWRAADAAPGPADLQVASLFARVQSFHLDLLLRLLEP